MEPPLPTKVKKKEKLFKMNSDKNHSFSVNINILNNILEIYANIESDNISNNFYAKKFSLEELKEMNKYFLLFETIDEIYEDLIILLSKNQSKIYEESNSIKINIPLESFKIKEIEFILNEFVKEENDQINELYSIISELKKEIKELKSNNKYFEEIKNLKEENKMLKEKVKEFDVYLPYLKAYRLKQDNKKDNLTIRNLDSVILGNSLKYNMVLKNWINPNLRLKADLLYRASRDGNDYQTFHNLCDFKGPNLVLVKLSDGNILGTYNPLFWDAKSGWKSDAYMFVFNLLFCMKSSLISNRIEGIYCKSNYGPESHFIGFQPKHNMNEPYLRVVDNTYEKASNLVPGKKTGYYRADEVEIFKINFK